MSYYIEYNNVDFSEVVGIRSIEMPLSANMEHSSIDVFQRDGNIFNGSSMQNRNIKLTLLVHPDQEEYKADPTIMDRILSDIKQAFSAREPKRLFLGDNTKYILCVPEGEITTNELRYDAVEVTINLVAYNPYFYSTEIQLTNNNNERSFVVNNTSDLPVYPTINLSTDEDAYFVQIDNQTTGQSILLGNYPELAKDTVELNSLALFDECDSLSNWTQSNESLDAGKAKGGTLAVDNRGGIIIGDFGSDSTSTWHGACYRRSLDTPCTNFKAKVNLTFTSTGTNGNPYQLAENDTESVVISGAKGYYYEVTASSTNVRDKASVKNGKKIGSLKKGYKLTDYTQVSNQWLQFSYNGRTAYVSTMYLAKKVGDGTTTTKEKNYVVYHGVNLRTQPTTLSSSSVIRTIPSGTVIRCYTEKQGTSQKFLKLAKSYKGDYGYVFEEGYLTEASDFEVSYDSSYDLNTADDKTGVLSVFGYANDNTNIFKIEMRDESQWYEHSIPEIVYNNKTILTDKTLSPNAKEDKDFSENSVSISKLLSGEYGNWNDSTCEFYIERIDNKVWASIVKIEDGLIKKTITSGSSYIDSSDVANKQLSYIVLYIGTQGDDIAKASDMALNYIEITNEDDIVQEEMNVPQIPANSDVYIDNSMPRVLIDNQEANNLVDIGSDFFALKQGENKIKVTSNANVNCDVIYNERYL